MLNKAAQKVKNWHINPTYLKRFHLAATILWFILIPPSVIWWRDSITWVVIMSTWANFAAHFSAWQGARSETNGNGSNGDGDGHADGDSGGHNHHE